ncbi:MAG TPA: hypothetical protein VGU02_00330 [Gaiellaceae bacterium]|nr:hypothetical protein [Gaiellaceae bacterium]
MTPSRGPGQASGLRRAGFPVLWRLVEELRLERFVARRVIPRLRLAEPSAHAFAQARARLDGEARRIAAADGPVVVGPYLSEVGLELLYWVPFLRRLVHAYGIDPQRLVAVSRGGVGNWYDGICGSYADVFEVMGEDEFRDALEAGWAEQDGQKQFEVGTLDRHVIDKAGLRDADVLHPSSMFGLFSEYWLHRVALPSVLEHLEIAPFTTPSDPELEARLPDRYVAARFYFRETFPDTPESRALAARVLRELAQDGPVVLLDTGLVLDDHSSVPLPEGVELLRPLAGCDPAVNLHAQSVVLANADAFVGTYGGLCYLANAYGVPSYALVQPPARKLGLSHTPVARRLAEAAGTSLAIVPTTALDALAS